MWLPHKNLPAIVVVVVYAKQIMALGGGRSKQKAAVRSPRALPLTNHQRWPRPWKHLGRDVFLLALPSPAFQVLLLQGCWFNVYGVGGCTLHQGHGDLALNVQPAPLTHTVSRPETTTDSSSASAAYPACSALVLLSLTKIPRFQELYCSHVRHTGSAVR